MLWPDPRLECKWGKQVKFLGAFGWRRGGGRGREGERFMAETEWRKTLRRSEFETLLHGMQIYAGFPEIFAHTQQSLEKSICVGAAPPRALSREKIQNVLSFTISSIKSNLT